MTYELAIMSKLQRATVSSGASIDDHLIGVGYCSFCQFYRMSESNMKALFPSHEESAVSLWNRSMLLVSVVRRKRAVALRTEPAADRRHTKSLDRSPGSDLSHQTASGLSCSVIAVAGNSAVGFLLYDYFVCLPLLSPFSARHSSHRPIRLGTARAKGNAGFFFFFAAQPLNPDNSLRHAWKTCCFLLMKGAIASINLGWRQCGDYGIKKASFWLRIREL